MNKKETTKKLSKTCKRTAKEKKKQSKTKPPKTNKQDRPHRPAPQNNTQMVSAVMAFTV